MNTDYTKIKNNNKMEETIEKPQKTKIVIPDLTENKIEEETEKKLEPVVKNPVKKQKKNLLERLVVGVIGPDGLPAVGKFISKEIIVPAVKSLIVDSTTGGVNIIANAITDGIKGAILGQTGQTMNTKSPANPYVTRGRVNYQDRYAGPAYPKANIPQVAASRDFGNIRGRVIDYVLETREEAYAALEALVAIAEVGNVVSVADYYELIGQVPQYADNAYGWTCGDLSRAQVIPVTGGGFVLKLPPTVTL